MQDREVNPPAGGSDVAGCDHPTVGTTGVGTVVGTAEGAVVADVDRVDVVGAAAVGATWRTGVEVVDAHPATGTRATRVADRARTVSLIRHRAPDNSPPTRSGSGTAGQG
jgi:hypothetical protein